MKAIIPILGLWVVALVATIIICGDANNTTTLLPVFAVCMVGSVMAVRWQLNE